MFANHSLIPKESLQQHQRNLDKKQYIAKRRAAAAAESRDTAPILPTVLEDKHITNMDCDWETELVPLLRHRLSSIASGEKNETSRVTEASRDRIETMMRHNAPLLEELGNEVAAFFYDKGTLTMQPHHIPSLILVLKDIVELHIPTTQDQCGWNKDEWLLFLKDFVIVLVETQLISVPLYEKQRIETMLVDSLLLLDSSLDILGVGFCQTCREPQKSCCCCQWRCAIS